MAFVILRKQEVMAGGEVHELEYTIHDNQQSIYGYLPMNVILRKNGRLVDEKKYIFETRQEKENKIQEIIRHKKQEGFRVLYTFPHF